MYDDYVMLVAIYQMKASAFSREHENVSRFVHMNISLTPHRQLQHSQVWICRDWMQWADECVKRPTWQGSKKPMHNISPPTDVSTSRLGWWMVYKTTCLDKHDALVNDLPALASLQSDILRWRATIIKPLQKNPWQVGDSNRCLWVGSPVTYRNNQDADCWPDELSFSPTSSSSHGLLHLASRQALSDASTTSLRSFYSSILRQQGSKLSLLG